ncbi:MAG: GH92 family glycosyl hydrolase [Bacteroidales bacterium]|nr:GH92 family glycosyl hydrolase [Bacteroidales bacterium]
MQILNTHIPPMRILTLAMMAAAAIGACAGNFTKYVNPFIGTGAIEGGLCGNCYPGATMPFGMVQLSPDTHPAPDWYNASGYDYNDSTIYGFSHTRLSGTGACDLIDISLFPTTTDRTSSAFSHEQEEAHPGLYRVELLDEGISASLSATERVGIHQYDYPAGHQCRLLVDIDHSALKGSWDRQIIQGQLRQVAPNALAGYRWITGWAKLRKVCFYIEFSAPIRHLALSDGHRQEPGQVINGRALKAWVDFGQMDQLMCKVGISPVSWENAKENLQTEAPGWSFDDYVAQADAAWEQQLGKIAIKAPEDKMTTFYTALYHAMQQPNLSSDCNGQYMGADFTVRQMPEGQNQYTTFSLWDTYRGAHPLYTILDPERSRDFVNSMLDHYEAYGYLPIWQLWGQDNYCMIGNHAIPVVVDAVLKDIPGINAERAWAAVKGASLTPHPNSPWQVWEKYGYMPEPLQTQSVSITLEDSYDDWCVAQLAQRLGHDRDAQHFGKRAKNYVNLYNEDTHFFQPKDENGHWIEPFDPLCHGGNGGSAFTEGNAWQYYWYVPQDVAHLVELTGGAKAFEQKLDQFFTLTDQSGEQNNNVSGCIGQYAHGNEPSHHVAYLYNYIGKPEKTRALVARIMDEMYDNTSSGYAGNDDCGEMSAWYIFSALGFYPVNPASGQYDLGIPMVEEAVISLPQGGEFRIVNNLKSQKVKSVTLDGDKLTTLFLPHSSIAPGSTLTWK